MEPQYLLFQFSYIPEVIIHADDYLFLKDFFTGSKIGMVWTMNLTLTNHPGIPGLSSDLTRDPGI